MMRYEGREISVPPHTHVFPNIIAVATNTKYWGDDALFWKPKRWIEEKDGQEEVMTPLKGSYIPWSDGPRYCPGKKFAQVEIVAVLAVLLWKHRIQIQPNAGESDKEARARCQRVIEDSKVRLTLQMKASASVNLRFVPRE